MGKLFIKNGFSDRNGTKSANNQLQISDFDAYTRADLMNCVNDYFRDSQRKFYGNAEDWERQIGTPIANYMGKHVFHKILPIEQNFSFDQALKTVEKVVSEFEYDDVLDILEFLAQISDYRAGNPEYYQPDKPPKPLAERLNRTFEEDNVGYHFVNLLITKITDKTQIESIENAIALHNDPSIHLSKALTLISEKGNKDFENSIKESITAVEAECEAIVGKQATLGEALSKLEKAGVYIHPSLKESFCKLYGYTSDAKGIRHAGNLDSKAATFAEAEYMLVSCSAFVSYLVAVSK